MTTWNLIENQTDLDGLLTRYGGFHDACLVEAVCRTGAYVDEARWMHFGSPRDRQLLLTFHSQQTGEPLQLRFTGVRRYGLTGWPERVSGELLDCTLTFWDGGILWADSESFDWTNPAGTYVLAQQMEWRIDRESRTEGPFD